MKKAILLLFSLLFTVSPVFLMAGETNIEQSLPIGLTTEEMLRLDEIGINHIVTDAPTGVLRNCSEWEPSEGVIIKYPLGISISFLTNITPEGP